MPITYPSSQVQQNFGRVMDRAMVEDEIIVERYGAPRVAIIAYERYQELLDAERKLLLMRLQQVSAQVAERAGDVSEEEVTALIEAARQEVAEEKSR